MLYIYIYIYNIYIYIYIYESNALPYYLCIKFSQMNAYAKYFDKDTKFINLLVNDKKNIRKIQWNMG